MDGFIKIPEFTTGERVSMFVQIRELAQERGLPAVVALAERGNEHDHETSKLDQRWAHRSRGRLYSRTAMDLGRRLQPVLRSIRDIARAQTRGLRATDALYEQVQTMLSDVYPGGLRPIMKLDFMDRAVVLGLLVDKLQTTYASLVQTLGMATQVSRLAEMVRAFTDAVAEDDSIRFEQVQEMRAQGQRLLRSLVALILGMFYDECDPAHMAARAELLQPVEHFKRRARPRGRRRRVAEPAPGPADAPAASTPVPDTASPRAPAPAAVPASPPAPEKPGR